MAGSGPTPREIAHIGILVHIMYGRPRDALAAVHERARSWPRDAFVLGTALGAFGLMAFSGDADHDRQRLDFINALAPHYPAEHTWMVTQRAWTRIECGLLAEGHDLVRRSLALRSQNGNAAHVQMHALFELGELQMVALAAFSGTDR